MNRVLPALFAVTLSVCYFNAAAQTDSTHFDLGRVKLKKDFTQNITIKGTDLERMPFTNLTEALNVWLNGVYTNSGTVQYVVDGIILANIDQYSVYDIDEVTMIQNATVQLNGATNQQQLILVKTKRHQPGKQGIQVAGQSFLSRLDKSTGPFAQDNSNNKFYHQLQVSAYHNGKNIQYGISAGLLRDVLPTYESNTQKYTTDPTFNRYRLNGWLQAKLNSWNSLSISMSYVPQHDKFAADVVGTITADSIRSKTRSYIINPTLTLQSAFTKNLHNELTLSYASGYRRNEYRQSHINFMLANPNFSVRDAYRKIRSKNFVASNHTTYQINAGNWQIEPALNAMFRYIELEDSLISVTRAIITGPGGPITSGFTSWSGGLRRLILLTPSVSLSYKNILNLQGGLLYDASDYNGAKYKKAFPFASVTADVLKMFAPGQASSLKIFGSWAQSAGLADMNSLMTDHSNSYSYSAAVNSASFTTGVTPIYSPDPVDSSTWAVQIGASFQLPNNRLIINYNYEKRDFTPLAYRQIPTPGGYQMIIYQPVFLSSAHRLGLLAKVIDGKKLSWHSGLNVTTIKLTSHDLNAEGTTAIGDFEKEDPSWTGGFTNRLSYKGIIFGVDALFHFDQQQLPGFISTDKTTSLVLQNVYAGYAFKLPKGRNLEVYADCRNLVRNEESALRNRKFYGLGLKAQL